MKPDNLDIFTKAYIECALSLSLGDDDYPLDSEYSINDISEECLTTMIADCAKFQTENSADISDIILHEGSAIDNLAKAGNDFWLTRNGHGAGFWDGDYPEEIGERLTAASHLYGEVDLYVGDDGLIYC